MQLAPSGAHQALNAGPQLEVHIVHEVSVILKTEVIPQDTLISPLHEKHNERANAHPTLCTAKSS